MAQQSGKPLLFIVEDNPAWSAVVEAKVGSKYDKKLFTNGEEAVANLHLKPAIVVLDFHLEGKMTGLDTLKQIKKQLPDVHVIMLSAQEDVQTAVDLMEAGAYDYVVKGDNAVNRLKIALRNLDKEAELQAEVVQLTFKVRRERLALYGVLVLIAIISLVIYLRICPDSRIIKMDPFGRSETQQCIIEAKVAAQAAKEAQAKEAEPAQ